MKSKATIILLAISTIIFVSAFSPNIVNELKTSHTENDTIKDSAITVKDRDGNIYETVKIGDQLWTKKNLEVLHFRNGDKIYQAQSSKEWRQNTRAKIPSWCYAENNFTGNVEYGIIYNWYAVSDRRGLAPEGWHIPSLDEFSKLINYLGGKREAGYKMKDSIGWHCIEEYTLKTDCNGSNESGFSAVPAGYRAKDGDYDSWNISAYWWTSNGKYYGNLRCVWIPMNSDKVVKDIGSKSDGFSVRCIKDENTTTEK